MVISVMESFSPAQDSEGNTVRSPSPQTDRRFHLIPHSESQRMFIILQATRAHLQLTSINEVRCQIALVILRNHFGNIVATM